MFFFICHNINRQKLPCTTVFACFIFTIRAMSGERGAASLRLIAALLLVNRNGVAGESSPCDWLPSNPSPLTAATQLLTCESSQLTCCSAAFNRGSATLTCDPVAINRRHRLSPPTPSGITLPGPRCWCFFLDVHGPEPHHHLLLRGKSGHQYLKYKCSPLP